MKTLPSNFELNRYGLHGAEFVAQPRFLPGAEEKIYVYYERMEEKLREVLKGL